MAILEHKLELSDKASFIPFLTGIEAILGKKTLYLVPFINLLDDVKKYYGGISDLMCSKRADVFSDFCEAVNSDAEFYETEICDDLKSDIRVIMGSDKCATTGLNKFMNEIACDRYISFFFEKYKFRT